MESNSLKWHALVSEYSFEQSCLDRVPICVQIGNASARTFVCPDCCACFSNSKAQLQHRRVVHQYRDPVLQRVDGTGVCYACSITFHTRLRVIAHVCDRRNNVCKPWILEHCPALSPPVLADLEAQDREARRSARKQGHTHAIATSHAKRADGKFIGRVSM